MDTSATEAVSDPSTVAVNVGTGLFEGMQLRSSQSILLQDVSLRTSKATILQNINCDFKPGTMTLILGPPSSGKTSLLKAGAGYYRPQDANSISRQRRKFWDFGRLKLSGDLTFNGKPVEQLPVRELIGFMHQKDILIPTLTVRETLRFALDVKGMSASSSEQQRNDQENALLRFLGLTKCADTKLGDSTSRGVSGGEQKRVCLGETLAGGYGTLFLDEYSTGLDSSATLDITKMLQKLVKEQNIVVVAALLQPPPEVFALFDNLIVLSEGNVIFNGPQSQILPYFKSIGYSCPSHIDVADFLQVVSTSSNEMFRSKRAIDTAIPRTATQFAAAFKKSGIKPAFPHTASTSSEDDLVNSSSMVNRLPWYALFSLVFMRELKVVWRDRPVIIARLMQAVVMGLVVGTLFFQIARDQFQTRMNYLWSGGTFFVGASLMRIPIAMEFRPVFYRQKIARFFPSWVFSTSAVITQFPLEILEVIIFSTLFYWLGGLAESVEAFLYATLVTFLITSSMNQLMAAVVAFSPNAVIAQASGVLLVLITMTFGGFAVAEPFIPKGWLWAYWGSPVSYGFRALAQNEFVRSGDWDVLIQGKTQGERYLEAYGIKSNSQWQWVDIGALIGFLCLYTSFTSLGLSLLTYDEERKTISPAEADAEKAIEEEVEEQQVNDKATEAESLVDAKSPEDDKQQFQTADVILSPIPTIPASHLPTGESFKSNTKSLSRLERGLSRISRASFLDVLPFSPAVLSWHSLTYSLTIGSGKHSLDKHLLSDVNGMARSGRMLALMGASGAGKSTLLDVLARRKNSGKISGQMLVNGKAVTDQQFRTFSAYVEQFDRLSSSSTVAESLAFSAALRLPSNFSKEGRISFIENVIGVLELEDIRDSLGRELSLSQRKKLSVGVELVANPAILFLDEPTSGLDSKAALNVIKVVRRISQMSRTIICTIHQPSSLLFEKFDDLLLLQAGKVAYFGELGPCGSKVISFLERIPGTVPHQSGQNTATWMLEAIGAGVKSQEQALATVRDTSNAGVNRGEHYTEAYKQSDLFTENERMLNLAKVPKGEEKSNQEAGNNASSGRFSASILTQIRLLVKRLVRLTWRTPETFLSKFATYAFICLVFGTAYSNFDYKTLSSTTQLIGFFASWFFVGISGWVLSSLADMVTIDGEKQLFDKERSSNYYSVISYTVSWALVVIPLNAIFAILFTNGLYWAIGYNSDSEAFAYFLLLEFLIMAAGNAAGLVIVSVTPNLKVANLLGGLLLSLTGLFAGMMINYENMTPVWSWIYWLIPVHYFFEAVVVSQFKNDVRPVYSPATGEEVTIESFIDYYFSGTFKHSHLDTDLVVLAGVFGLLIILFAVVLKYVNHYKR